MYILYIHKVNVCNNKEAIATTQFHKRNNQTKLIIMFQQMNMLLLKNYDVLSEYNTFSVTESECYNDYSCFVIMGFYYITAIFKNLVVWKGNKGCKILM